MRYLAIAFLIGLLVACGTPSAAQPTIIPSAPSPEATIAPAASPESTIAAAPTAEVPLTLATDAPDLPSPEATVTPAEPTDTSAAEPTNAPIPTAAPAVAPTDTPAAAPPSIGAAPQGSDCPADHPVKGNIRDRNPNKGEKIYHLPGDNGYAQTKPERCFVDSKEAEAAGFRAVK